ncbi:uncharacterized protein LOC129729253 [Wyeomyia smithii]|uniref:uncharacterized protein LOC129729253 n=1 Tax=Wyeomyia smithii TaxID=174621 RepID=UPI00246807FF|nr:uncharacterized protein LOC129729253 [Wyeomyia smithii]
MVILLLLVSCFLHQSLKEKFAVKGITLYDINIVSFEPLSTYDKTALLLGTIRVTRKARNTFVMSGDVEFLRNWGNEYTVYYHVETSIGMILIKNSEPFCEFFNSELAVVKKFRQYSTVPPGNYCPLPKNRYEVNNYGVDESDLPMMLPKDTYTLIAKVMTSDEHVVLSYTLKIAVS